MDALSEVLANSRAERAYPAHFLLHAPWSLQSNGVRGLLVRACKGHPYWIAYSDNTPVQVHPGDLVLMAPGTAHTISSDPKLQPTPFGQFSKLWKGTRGLATLEFGGKGPGTEVFTLHTGFSSYFRRSILSFIPPFLVLRQADMRLSTKLTMLLESSIPLMFDRPSGWGVARLRLAELAVVSILGDYFSSRTRFQSMEGWLKGLSDPAIARSLARIHNEPHLDWTNEKLAEIAIMSLSRFRTRFRELVGIGPIEYLTEHRMILAADQMEARQPSISELSKFVGYQTEKGFIRAFTRWSGVTPAAYLRRYKE